MSTLVRILGHRWFGAARDAVFVFAATATVFTISDGYPEREVFALAAINTALVFAWGGAADLYDVSHPRVAFPPMGRLVRALIWVLLSYLAVHFVTAGQPERRTIMFASMAAVGATSLGYLLRAGALVWFQRRGMLRERMILIGGGDETEVLAAQIGSERRLAIHLVGVLDEFSAPSSRVGPVNVLGDPLDLEAAVDRTRATAIIVVVNAISWEAQQHVMQVAADRPSLRVFMVAGISDLLSSEVLPARDGLPSLVRLRPAQLHRSDAFVKRVMDVSAAVLLLPALALLLVVALLTGGRPLTRRVDIAGRDGRTVGMRLLDAGHGSRIRASLADGRAGKLPALPSVIRGRLSMVGPRPMPVEMLKADRLWQQPLLRMSPGLTGPWDDSAEGGSILDELSYIRTYTPWSDVRLLVASARRVMRRETAVPAMREVAGTGHSEGHEPRTV
jgi:lipopolysaccharide/colanic/teichoic acid biosynthesis glycosyltransferase